MTDQTVLEFKVDALQAQLEKADSQISDLAKGLAALKLEEAERERKNLRWGIGVLGSVVSVLGWIVWNKVVGKV